jgi:hypothetical protein
MEMWMNMWPEQVPLKNNSLVFGETPQYKNVEAKEALLKWVTKV